MKKFLYSNYTKTIAVLLFIVSIVLGALTATNGIAEYCNEKELVYGFENDFNEARFFSSLLDAPESAIFNAVDNLYSELDDETIQALQKGHSFIDPGSYEGVIRLFPCWNKKSNASFTNLRADGAFLVSAELKNENIEALKKGLPNLIKHLQNIKNVYHLPVVVAINKFACDTQAEIDLVKEEVEKQNVKAILANVWGEGGMGALELAREVVNICEESNED